MLVKNIIPAGKFKVQTPKGRIWEDFPEERLKRIAAQSNRMMGEGGLRIPAPFNHAKDAVPLTETEIAQNKSSDAFENGGYWQHFWVEEIEGVPWLRGRIDPPGDPNKEGTPAWKARHTNQEVSLSLNNNLEDGLGRTWTDGLIHVAFVNNPVVPGQKPFEEYSSSEMTIVNMSMLSDDPGSEGEESVDELKAALNKIGITLPSSTTAKTLYRDLLVSALALGESGVKRNNSTELETAPIYMSLDGEKKMKVTKEMAKALVDAGAINGDTNAPFKMEDFHFEPETTKDPVQASVGDDDPRLETALRMAGALQQRLASDMQKGIKNRIDALVGKVIDQEFADKHLYPQVEFQMSISPDKEIEDHPLELTLTSLEAQAAKQKPAQENGLPLSASIEDPAGENEMTEEQTQKVVDDLLKEFQ